MIATALLSAFAAVNVLGVLVVCQRLREPRLRFVRELRRRLSFAWFWLTHDVVCSWCKTRVHRAWIPLKPERLTNSISIPRVTHGICPRCFEKVLK